jgi:hypothetical protein
MWAHRCGGGLAEGVQDADGVGLVHQVGIPGFRIHDLRHTAASVWLAAGTDPKVVQWVLGHVTAAMTMDLYGHMIDANLWQAARLVGDISETFEPLSWRSKMRTTRRPAGMPGKGGFSSGAALGNRTPDLRITSVSRCTATGVGTPPTLRFPGCSCWRLLIVHGPSGAPRGHDLALLSREALLR